jgi:hypothetical protein
MAMTTEIENPSTKPARCSCGLQGPLGELREHLQRMPMDQGHVLVFHGGRAVDLSTMMRRAALAWATADREVTARAKDFEDAEARIRDLEETPIPVDDLKTERMADCYSQLLESRDVAVCRLRAAMVVCDDYEQRWRDAARALLDEMCPASEVVS